MTHRSESSRAKGRHTLTRSDVVEAAERLLAEGEASAVSMRALARSLGVAVSTLYWHVRSQEELWSLVVEEAFRGLRVPTDGSWDDRLRAFLIDTRAVLAARPALLPLFWSAGWSQGPEVLRGADALVGLIAASGIPEERVADAYYAVFSFLIGFVRLETLSPDTPAYDGPPGDFPSLDRYRPASDRAGMDRRFAEGLELLIAGLAAAAPGPPDPT